MYVCNVPSPSGPWWGNPGPEGTHFGHLIYICQLEDLTFFSKIGGEYLYSKFYFLILQTKSLFALYFFYYLLHFVLRKTPTLDQLQRSYHPGSGQWDHFRHLEKPLQGVDFVNYAIIDRQNIQIPFEHSFEALKYFPNYFQNV